MDNCLVKAKLHPLSAKVINDVATPGESIQNLVDRLGEKNRVNQWYAQKVYVEINGTPILPSAYATTYVKNSDLVVIQFCIPEGGGDKNPLKIALMLVVTAAALWVGQWQVLGAWAPYLGAAVAVLGNFAITALIPPEPLSSSGLGHDDADKTSIYSISGMRNYVPMYKPLPLVLGRVRFAPPYGALPYTRVSGNDQFLYCYVIWGQGPLLVETLRIGDTLLSTYDEVTVSSTSGRVTDSELLLVPSDVYPDQIGSIVEKDTPVIRTSQLLTDSISLQLGFPKGLFTINEENGKREDATVVFTVSRRVAGTTTWTLVTTETITDTAAYPKRVAVDVAVPERGAYDIKVERVTADSTSDTLYNELHWTEMQSITNQDPVNFPIPVAKTQLRIKATEQLTGVIDDLNGWVTSICMDYEYTTDTWVERATSNPASLYRHVYTSPCTARPLTVDQLDLDALEIWHNFCRINGYKYNRVHDTRESVQEIIQKICHAGQAMFVMRDDIRSVVIDTERSIGPVQLFTPANSKNLVSKKTFEQDLHGYRIAFNNEDADNIEDEVIVYTQGYNQNNAHIFEALQFPGVTTVDECIAHAKYHLATRKYRSELFSWESDWEHLNCSRGDLVAIANDCILVAQATGRIKSIDTITRTIVLDRKITVVAQTDYNLVIRTTPNGNEYANIVTKAVTAQFPDWTTDTLTYTGEMAYPVRRGDVYSFGEAGLETILAVVTSKRPKQNMTATLTAVQYSWPEIAAYMAGEFPALNSGITTPVFRSNLTPPPPTITYVATGASSSTTNPDGTTLNRITLVLTIPSGWAVAVASVQVDILTADGWKRSPNTDHRKPIVFDNVNPGTHEFRARSVSADGRVSAWVYKTITQVDGTPRPQPIIAMSVIGNLFQNDITVTLPTDFRDNYRVAIYCSAGINDRDSTGAPIAVLSGGTQWSHTGLIPEVQYYYWARVYSTGAPGVIDPDAWGDESGDWTDGDGDGWTGPTLPDTYGSGVMLYSDWYPLNQYGGVQASPITDNKRILDMLTLSITQGQLAQELNTIIDGAVDGINYQQQFLENAWTIKIQEINGNPYLVGMGLVLYPDWEVGVAYVVDDYVWKNEEDNVYRCTGNHTSSLANQPPIQTYWELIPYGKKSGMVIVADQFAIVKPDGTGEIVPFIVSGNIVGINGTLVVNGTVRATALSTTDIYTVTLQSTNYVPGVSGYRFDADTGTAELNNFTMTFNYNDLDDIPTSLGDINSGEWDQIVLAQDAADTALASITAMEDDGILSIAEKKQWQLQWPGIQAEYTSVRASAVTLSVSVTALDVARNNLYNFLNGSPQYCWAATLTNSNLTPSLLRTYVESYHTALQNTIAAVTNKASDNAFDDAKLLNAYTENGVTYIRKLAGGSYNSTGAEIGALKIRLPQFNSRTMLKFKVDVFNFIDNTSFTLLLAGYNHDTSGWLRCSVQLIGNTDGDNAVRFGHDGVRNCVWIGETNSSWSYVKVSVYDLQAGYSNYAISQWEAGWVISLATSFGTVQQTFSDNLVDANATKYVGGTLATSIETYSLNPAGRINTQATTISGGKITTGTIAADRIVANSLTAGQIAANAITASELAANSVYATNIAAGQVIAGKLAANSVVASNIVAGEITVTEIYGLARINGNRLNVIASGSVVVEGNSSADIVHNLGRYVLASVNGGGDQIGFAGGTGVTANKFTIVNYDSVAKTVTYVYM